ncbi:tyramine receptor 1-like protein [Leptotrombidium deliense]|uniref:Tyramine receptor 1-like protein n=1 Tax=Leptotrombidium deliense TaxID=299467 RepID=A0A443S6P0_9ACAR|nr:tyramine receptor 1-like protein [Leptotrombidium deliense]
MAVLAWSLALIIAVFPTLVIPAIFNVFHWSDAECFYPAGYIFYITFCQYLIPLFVINIIFYFTYKVIQGKLDFAIHIEGEKTADEKCANTNCGEISLTSSNIGIEESEQSCCKVPSNNSFANERRAVRVLAIVVIAYFVCWAPFIIMDNIFYYWPHLTRTTPHAVVNVVYWIGYINAACNPIIYTIFNYDFRNAFKKLFCR